jgi:hypothetical protein
MASPNFNALVVTLSYMIDDPVAAAATNGDTITSAQRVTFLNDAVRICLNKWAASENYTALRSYLLDGSANLTNSVAALSSWTGTPFIILSAKNSTDNVYIRPAPQRLKHAFETSEYSNYFKASTTAQWYSVENGNFTLLDGTTTSTDAIYLRYIKGHTNLTVDNATDIGIDAQFWGELLNEAYKIYLQRVPTNKNIKALQVAG